MTSDGTRESPLPGQAQSRPVVLYWCYLHLQKAIMCNDGRYMGGRRIGDCCEYAGCQLSGERKRQKGPVHSFVAWIANSLQASTHALPDV